MRQAPTGAVRLAAIAWCVAHSLAGTGCARHAATPAASAPAPLSAADSSDTTDAVDNRTPAMLEVTNSNWSDVRIYLVRGGVWLRLGLVTTNSVAEFSIPADFLRDAGSVQLVAYPVAGRGAYSTTLTGVVPGDVVLLTVENYLPYSHLVVR